MGRRFARRGALLVGLVASALTLPLAGAANADTTTTTSTTLAPVQVSPAGPVTVHLDITLTLKVFQVDSNVPLTGTAKGTVDSAGNLAFKKADMTFPQTGVLQLGPAQSQITPQATTDWNGKLDPATGKVTLTGGMETIVKGISPVAFPACPVGPITLHLASDKSGGVGYDKTTGKATLGDNTFTAPAVPSGTSGCAGDEAVVNGALGLPSKPGDAAAVVTLTFSPKLQIAAGAPVTTTSTVPVTVAGQSTTTTEVAPTLPRTGNSSGPLGLIAFTAIASGSALLVGSRRRDAAHFRVR